MSYKGNLGKRAIARTRPGCIQDKGRIIAYCDAPTFTIERENGTHFSWRADLCEIVEEYTYETAGVYDNSGYVIYSPNGKRIEPWRLVEMLNSEILPTTPYFEEHWDIDTETRNEN